MNRKTLAAAVRWLIIVTMPFLITVVTLQVIINWNAPDYPSFEYERIQPDRYGFTPEQRLFYARASLDYLRRSERAEEVIYLLEELWLPDDSGSFYNEREIEHMLDVKRVIDAFRLVSWILLFIFIVGLAYLLTSKERRLDAYKALFYGGAFTAVVVLTVIVLILLSWNFVFVQFHEILFPPDTWTFNYTDSLIRLFPEKFWFDFGVIWTVFILAVGILTGAVGYLLLRKSR